MLYLVSLGIWDVKDMSLRAYDILTRADKVYFERYTSNTLHSKESLERCLGRKVILLSREEVENMAEKIVDEASIKDICLCAQGDILSATTHVYFLRLCYEKNVQCKVIHGSSIFTSIAKTGLSLYRFGRVVSLPHPESFPTYPQTPFENIRNNYKSNLHSLVLLDIHLRCYDALDLISRYLPELTNKKIFVCYGLGGEKEKILYGKLSSLKKEVKYWDDYAQCIVIPANMEFYEEEIAKIWEIKK